MYKKTQQISNKKQKKTKKRVSEWRQSIVEIQRVSKVVKGGKKLSFRTTLILGNQKGQVGVGVGKADEISLAIKKALNEAKKYLINVPITKILTITHISTGVCGSAKVLIKPVGTGTGVIAGSSIRIVLELAGIQNIVAKQMGSSNLLNNAKATINALSMLKTTKDVANARDISIEKIYSYKN